MILSTRDVASPEKRSDSIPATFCKHKGSSTAVHRVRCASYYLTYYTGTVSTPTTRQGHIQQNKNKCYCTGILLLYEHLILVLVYEYTRPVLVVVGEQRVLLYKYTQMPQQQRAEYAKRSATSTQSPNRQERSKGRLWATPSSNERKRRVP